MAKPNIITRASKGAPLSNPELDGNFTALRDSFEAVDRVVVVDSRGDNTPPSGLVPHAITADFKIHSVTASPVPSQSGDYDHVVNVAGWQTSGDNFGTGGGPSQFTLGPLGMAIRSALTPSTWGPWLKLLVEVGRTNWKGSAIESAVIGMLSWNIHGNGHVLRDFSDRGAGIGMDKDAHDAEVPYNQSNRGALMFTNGSQTFGARVDSARLADIASKLDGYSSRAWGTGGGSAYAGSGAAIEIRERDLMAGANPSYDNSPHIGLHYGGVVARTFGVGPDGYIYARNDDNTAFTGFRASSFIAHAAENLQMDYGVEGFRILAGAGIGGYARGLVTAKKSDGSLTAGAGWYGDGENTPYYFAISLKPGWWGDPDFYVTSAFTSVRTPATDAAGTQAITAGWLRSYIAASGDGSSKPVSNTDFDNLINLGFYRGMGMAHAPALGGADERDFWWHIMVELHTIGWVKQTATAFSTGNTYERVCKDGVWQAWRRAVLMEGGDIVLPGNGQVKLGPNTGWGTTLVLGGNGGAALPAGTPAVRATTNNLHIDAGSAGRGYEAGEIFLNFYNGRDVLIGNGEQQVVAAIRKSGLAEFSAPPADAAGRQAVTAEWFRLHARRMSNVGTNLDISNTDANNLLFNGDYSGCYIAHMPGDDTGFWYIEQDVHGDAWIKQTATALGPSAGAGTTARMGEKWERTKANGTWQPWELLSTLDRSGRLAVTTVQRFTDYAFTSTGLSDSDVFQIPAYSMRVLNNYPGQPTSAPGIQHAAILDVHGGNGHTHGQIGIGMGTGRLYGRATNYGSTSFGTFKPFAFYDEVPILGGDGKIPAGYLPALGAEVKSRDVNGTVGVLLSDRGTILRVAAGADLHLGADAPDGFYFWTEALGKAFFVGDSTTVDGVGSFDLYPGELRRIYRSGGAWRSTVERPFVWAPSASGTFYVPPGYEGREVDLDLIGGGGGGSSGLAAIKSYQGAGAGNPGGAPGRYVGRYRLPAVGTAITYAIGGGGLGGAPAVIASGSVPVVIGAAGADGGDTVFGEVTAYGGAAGQFTGNNPPTGSSAFGRGTGGGSVGGPGPATFAGGAINGPASDLGGGAGAGTSTPAGASARGVGGAGRGGGFDQSGNVTGTPSPAGQSGGALAGSGTAGGTNNAAGDGSAGGDGAAGVGVRAGNSGGGGGASYGDGVRVGGRGGDGGYPGGAGGSGGGCQGGVGSSSGRGGNGANGRLIVRAI